MTEHDVDTPDSGRRTWLYLMALAWAFFGLATMVEGSAMLGITQLLLAAVSLGAARSDRVAAFADAPLFCRKRPVDR